MTGPSATGSSAENLTASTAGSGADDSTRVVPYVCPFCGEEDLRPLEQRSRWHCRSCLRVFSVAFFGLLRPDVASPSATPPATPAST